MALAPGTRLGVYDITAQIGEGGMGQVYRAMDTTLGRQVAIKILPDAFASDPERLARFEREAKTLASLNHPHIAAIYGCEQSGGQNALVMELVEGEDLSQRIARGGIPIEEALPIAKQIAEALEAAHEQGIIHRDLKPANIKIRDDGTVKVLDFGLAKGMEPAAGSSPNLSMSPTILSPAQMSGVGVILGTAAYMAPEQARGKAVDKRADIWAFGCVLYEMLTGRRAFEGDDVSTTLAAVLKDDVNWGVLPANVPLMVDTLLRRCLERDPKRRLRDIGDWAWLVDQASPALARPQPGSSPFGIAGWIAAALLTASTAGLAFLHFRVATADTASVRATILPPDGSAFASSPPALSPDGRTLAFSARSGDGKTQLWLRSLDSSTARPLAGTEDGEQPFWSPDGKSIGFAADGKLLRIAVSGGPAITLSRVTNMRGGSWNAANEIVFTQRAAPLMRIAASGGSLRAAAQFSDGDNTHQGVSFLPDGTHFLFASGRLQGGNQMTVRIGSLDSLESQALLTAESSAVYSSGRLLFLRNGALMAQAFDVNRMTLGADAAQVAQQIGTFSASRNGTLVYATATTGGLQLTWFDRAGKRGGTLGEAANFVALPVHLSPDGTNLLASIDDSMSHKQDVWVFDTVRGLRRRLTFGANAQTSIWSPDGRTVVFSSNQSGRTELYRKRSDGSGTEEQLTGDSGHGGWPLSWSPDGKALLYFTNSQRALATLQTATDKVTGTDLWVLPDPLGPAGASKPFPFLQTPANETLGQFSPDGRWVAYQSDESGRNEVYAASFPGPGGKRQLSTNGGISPRWRRDGQELFYLEGNRLMAVDVAFSHGSLETGATHPLFAPLAASYEMTADGQRVIAPAALPQAGPEPLTLVLNWPSALKN